MALSTLIHEICAREKWDVLERVAPCRKPVTLTADCTLEQALDILHTNHIHSAPVVVNDKVVDIVDNLDFAAFVMEKLHYEQFGKKRDSSFNIVTYMKEHTEKINEILGSKIPDILNSNCHRYRGQVFRTVRMFSSMMDVIRELRTAYRVVVVDEQGAILRVISQSDVIKYLYSRADEFGEAKNRSLQVLAAASSTSITRNIVFVKADVSMAEALSALVADGATAAPVLDSKGETLVSHLSASDLKGITRANFLQLFEPVINFCPRRTLISVDLNTSFGELLRIIVENKVHHVYVMDKSDSKPSGVVSLTDVLSVL